jgi:hypothetical protein
VSFQVLTATSMKMAVFWLITTCIVINADQRFREFSTAIIRVMGDYDHSDYGGSKLL